LVSFHQPEIVEDGIYLPSETVAVMGFFQHFFTHHNRRLKGGGMAGDDLEMGATHSLAGFKTVRKRCPVKTI